MKTGMTKGLQKSVKKHGSVLKAFRSQGGGGAGLMAGGWVLLIFGMILGLICVLALGVRGLLVGAFMWAPGLLMVLGGHGMYRKRLNKYLDFYQKETGYSMEELQEADRELMGNGAVAIVSKTDRGREEVLFMITDHYFLSIWPVKGCYLLKLDDIVAAFHSAQIPGIGGYCEGVQIISREDTKKPVQKNPFTKKEYEGFKNSLMSEQRNAQVTCMEAVEEIARRAPHVITSQNIMVDNMRYNLLSMDNWQADWARILGE